MLHMELHFEKAHEVPASQRVFPSVRIIHVKEKGEFLVERDYDNRAFVRINAGGLALILNFQDFLREVYCMLEEELGFERWQNGQNKKK